MARSTAVLLPALCAVLTGTACSSAHAQQRSAPSTSLSQVPPTTSAPSSSAAATVGALPSPGTPGSAPTSATAASPVPLPTLHGSGTGTPATHVPLGPVPSRTAADATPLINTTYDTWLADLTGLDANLTQVWVKAVGEVATPRLQTAAARAADAIQRAHEHGVGTLVDSHRTVTVSADGRSAKVFDCLDELHWYVVEDASGKPDPGVQRAYLQGGATMVLQGGSWLVDTWASAPQSCTP